MPRYLRSAGRTWSQTRCRRPSLLEADPIATLDSVLLSEKVSQTEKILSRIHTIQVCRSHKGDVNTEVTVIGGAVQTQVDAERHRRPCGILLSAVKAYLGRQWHALVLVSQVPSRPCSRTLLAGFVFSFSKILSDCCFDARALILGGGAGDPRRVRSKPIDFWGTAVLPVYAATVSREDREDAAQSNVGIIIKETLMAKGRRCGKVAYRGR